MGVTSSFSTLRVFLWRLAVSRFHSFSDVDTVFYLSIYLSTSQPASQPRTSLVKFARSPRRDPVRIIINIINRPLFLNLLFNRFIIIIIIIIIITDPPGRIDRRLSDKNYPILHKLK